MNIIGSSLEPVAARAPTQVTPKTPPPASVTVGEPVTIQYITDGTPPITWSVEVKKQEPPSPPKITTDANGAFEWGKSINIQLEATGTQPITWRLVRVIDADGGNLSSDKVSLNETTGVLTITSKVSDEWGPYWMIDVTATNNFGKDSRDFIIEWEPPEGVEL